MLLLNSRPLVIIPELASLIGLNEAIIIQQLHYWLEINKKSNKHFIEERYWAYNTYEDWQEQFPFWSVSTIKRTIARLKEAGFIITGNFNQLKLDRTIWYSIDYNQLKKIEEQKEKTEIELEVNKAPEGEQIPESIDFSHKVILTQCNSSECSNPLGQNDPMEELNLTPPIPEITTEITKEYKESVSQSNNEKNDEQTEKIIPLDNVIKDAINKYGLEVVRRSLAKIRSVEEKTGKIVGKKGFKKYLEKVCKEQAEIKETTELKYHEYSNNVKINKKIGHNIFGEIRDLNYLIE